MVFNYQEKGVGSYNSTSCMYSLETTAIAKLSEPESKRRNPTFVVTDRSSSRFFHSLMSSL